MIEDAFVVVRTTGERTLSTVKQIVAHEVGDRNMAHVSAYPFSETLKRSFECAIERDLPWTICVDADVLPFRGVVNMFRRAMKVSSQDAFGIQGYVLDKFFGGSRPAGVRCYRTSMLARAIDFIPFGGNSKRPETYTVKAMKREGYRWGQHGILSGIHDFEQYYKDIYRTCFFHAQKHRRHLPLLQSFWERAAKDDNDFLVALRGASDGMNESEMLGLDARNFDKRFEGVLEELGLEEKQPLSADYNTIASLVDETAETWIIPKEYDRIRAHMEEVRHPLRRFAALGVRKMGLGGLFGIR